MKEKKKKVKVEEDEDSIIITFSPSDSFVIPKSVLVKFKKETKKEEGEQCL